MGSKIGALDGSYRARQNAVFENDYLIGKLGCSRVTAVVKGTVARLAHYKKRQQEEKKSYRNY